MKQEDLRCYMGWREKPIGTGESAWIIAALLRKDNELTDMEMGILMPILKVTTFSEETIDFTVGKTEEKYWHKDVPCYVGWRGREAAFIIIQQWEGLIAGQLKDLTRILEVSKFTEDTVNFTIQELDW